MVGRKRVTACACLCALAALASGVVSTVVTLPPGACGVQPYNITSGHARVALEVTRVEACRGHCSGADILCASPQKHWGVHVCVPCRGCFYTPPFERIFVCQIDRLSAPSPACPLRKRNCNALLSRPPIVCWLTSRATCNCTGPLGALYWQQPGGSWLIAGRGSDGISPERKAYDAVEIHLYSACRPSYGLLKQSVSYELTTVHWNSTLGTIRPQGELKAAFR